MKLSIDELRPLVASPELVDAHLGTLQQVETLDLSNGAIFGDHVAHLLHFIAVSTRPVALRSVDLSHNRLGDDGALALATLLKAHAKKLRSLVAVDLFDNGVRDEGALALAEVVRDEGISRLHELAHLGLHDNDISERVLREIDMIWKEIATSRLFSWTKTTPPPEALDGRANFNDLFRAQAERVKEEQLALISDKLMPVSTLLKRIMWHYVVAKRMLFESAAADAVMLRVFRTPDARDDKNFHWRMTDPKFALFVESWRQRAVQEADPNGVLVASSGLPSTKHDIFVDAVVDQMTALFAAIEEAGVVETQCQARGWTGALTSEALSRALGLTVTVTKYVRSWAVRRDDAQVQVSSVYYEPFSVCDPGGCLLWAWREAAYAVQIAPLIPPKPSD